MITRGEGALLITYEENAIDACCDLLSKMTSSHGKKEEKKLSACSGNNAT